MNGLIDQSTTFIIQGLTGRLARFYAKKSLDYGTNIVAGVVPNKGGMSVLDLPVFSKISEAKKHFSIDASLIFVPKESVKEALLEAIYENIPLICCLTEEAAIHDILEVKKALKSSPSRLIGPSSYGWISPGKILAGLMPSRLYEKGNVGIISRSASLGYEAVFQMRRLQIGVSTHISIGKDPFVGEDFLSLLPFFAKDPDTKALLLLGEGGDFLDRKLESCLEKEIGKPLGVYIPQKGKLRKKALHLRGITKTMYQKDTSYPFVEKKGCVLIKDPSKLGEFAKRLLESAS